MRPLDLSMVLAVLALAVGPARADEPRPSITELRVGDHVVTGLRVARGEHLEARGTSLHVCPATPPGQAPAPCAHPGLRVRIGATDAAVLTADASRVLVNVGDDAPLGRTQLEVLVGGRSAGRLALIVVERGADTGRGPDDDAGARGAQDPGEAFREGFQITRFDVVRDAAGTSFVVEGTALRVPDGLSMRVAVEYSGHPVEQSCNAPIVGGRYRATFGPFARPLPLGVWTACATFVSDQQPPRTLRPWRQRLLPAEREALARIAREEPTRLGTAEELAAQREAMVARYREVAGTTSALLEDVVAAYASACRVLFRDAATNTVRKPAHLAHAREVGAARTPEEAARVEADLRFATAAGHLKADDYQRWIEGTFVPAWLDSYLADATYREATQFPIEPGASVLSGELHAIVLRLLQIRSRALFQAATLAVPASLEGPPSGATLQPVDDSELTRRVFEQRRDALLRRLTGP